jgi:hypothetical protein
LSASDHPVSRCLRHDASCLVAMPRLATHRPERLAAATATPAARLPPWSRSRTSQIRNRHPRTAATPAAITQARKNLSHLCLTASARARQRRASLLSPMRRAASRLDHTDRGGGRSLRYCDRPPPPRGGLADGAPRRHDHRCRLRTAALSSAAWLLHSRTATATGGPRRSPQREPRHQLATAR